jgi:signal transduction histidine kinase
MGCWPLIGIGFQPPDDYRDLARTGHLGILGMSERAEAIGGQIEITSSPGQGTTLHVFAPLGK